MGFFSKLWKGIKNNIFKPIGKAIKSGLKSIGKFMDKIGIVGQIGLMFILPGIGGLLGQGIGALAASANPVLAGVGQVLQTAGKFANTVGNAFKTVTDGITSFVGNVGKGFINQVGKTFGKEGLIFQNGPTNVSQGFQKWMQGVADDVRNIPSPFRDTAKTVTDGVARTYQEKLDLTSQIGTPEENFRMRGVSRPEVTALPNDVSIDPPFKLDINDNNIARNIIEQENKATNSFFNNIVDFTQRTIEQTPSRIIDTVGQQVASGVGDQILTSAGIGPEPPQVTQVTNVIPEFNHTPITNLYNQNGLNYGAIPESRLQYYAAQNLGGDFGQTAYKQFSSFGRV